MSTNNPPPARQGVAAAGNWIIDHVKIIDRWPAQDALANITAESDGNGGGAYNILKNLARLKCGFPLTGIGLIGNDADGATILRDCDTHGIDRSGLRTTDAAHTSYTDVMTVANSGRRTFFHQHGTNALLEAGHCELAKIPARIFYLGYLCLLQKLDEINGQQLTPAAHLFEEASSIGFVTVADLVSNESSDFPAVVNPSLPHLDYLLLNEYELARLSGEREAGTEPAQFGAQAEKILARGIRRAVIVHYPQGAMCVRPGHPPLLQTAVRVPPALVVGTAGAGDAFGAGFLIALHEGWEMQACLESGVCVAAASLRGATCSDAIESWETCLAFGRKLGFHPGQQL